MEDESKKPKINNISFTYDYFMFSFGTEEGFYIYNVKPFELLSHQKFEGGILFTLQLQLLAIIHQFLQF